MNEHKIGDIDIDVSPQTDKECFGVRAIIYDEDKHKINPHPSGYYIHSNMPIDIETGMAAIPYDEAESKGFHKIDLLTNKAYERFRNKKEVRDCLNKEPDWTLLLKEDFVKKLPHIPNYHEFCLLLEPKSIEDLADLLALMRPGKQHLLHPYIEDKEKTRKKLYKKNKKGFMFKKSHAIAYACMIVCVMNKLSEMRNFIKWSKTS